MTQIMSCPDVLRPIKTQHWFCCTATQSRDKFLFGRNYCSNECLVIYEFETKSSWLAHIKNIAGTVLKTCRRCRHVGGCYYIPFVLLVFGLSQHSNMPIRPNQIPRNSRMMKKKILKTALHYCSITRSAMPNYLLERWGDIWTVYRQLWKDNATGQCHTMAHSHHQCHHHLPHHPHIVVMVITIVIFITIVSAYKS